MNYLRSAVVVLASASLIALAAGCSSEATDGPSADVAPSTEVMSSIEPQYTPPPGSLPVCPDEYSPEKPAFYQVQASRVAKYLFGGNDPFDMTIDPATGDPVGFSNEFGEYGRAKPDMGNAACMEAQKCIRTIHDSLYPPKSRDQKYSLIPTSYLKSGPLDKACGLEVDTFKMVLSSSVPASDWAVMNQCSVNLDGCWGYGVSGFFHGVETVSCDSKDADQKTCGQRWLDFDPEPAALGAALGSWSGATAGATYVNTGVKTTVIEWSGSTWTSASWLPVGTPCSTGPLPAGEVTKMAIVAQYPGSANKKCL